MPVYKIKRKSITITLPEEDYHFIENEIWKNQDTIRTVPGYVRRLVRHYIWSLRTEAAIREGENRLKQMREGLKESE